MHGCFEGKNVFISYFEEIVQVVQPCKNVTPLMLPRAVRSGIICWGNAAHASQKESFKLTTPIFPKVRHVRKGRLVLFFACWRIPLPVLRNVLSTLCCRCMWVWGTIWRFFSLHTPFSSKLKAPHKSKVVWGKLYQSYISSCIIFIPKNCKITARKSVDEIGTLQHHYVVIQKSMLSSLLWWSVICTCRPYESVQVILHVSVVL